MKGQEFIDRGSEKGGIIFGENRLFGNLFVGVGVLPSIINTFKSGRKLRMQRDRTGGLSNG